MITHAESEWERAMEFVCMYADATCEHSLAELISLARKMAHTEARNLWLKTLPLLPVYFAWPFIAIAAVTDTYGWHQTVWVLCRVRLMCAYIDAALSFNTTLPLLHFSALTAENTITFWCWHVAQSFFLLTRAGFIHLHLDMHYRGIFVELLSVHMF